MTDAADSESWAYQVDPANSRSVHVNQRTMSVTKTSIYYLDLIGNVTQVVYPTGRVVNYTFDAANRPSTAVDGSNGITYATDFQTVPSGCLAGKVCYTPEGTFYALSIGQATGFTGLNLTHTYNNRLQPLEFNASSSGGNAIDISYNFVDPSTSKNAGIVYGITNNIDSTRSQTFSYDQLNRITSAQTTSTHATSPSHCWAETYQFDGVANGAWGNLTQITASTNPNYTGCSQESGFTANADANNHLSIFSYDLSGNTQSDGVVTNYLWNGESQLKSAAGVTYTYDGNGRRVSKVGSKLYWYGSGGDILAETNTSGATTAEYTFFGGKRIAMIPWSGKHPVAGNPRYYVEDMLGTSRVLTTNTGVVCYDADFYPYGGERSYTNTCSQNYKFEGKESDTETGNDDFGARYYSNRFGRWLSADWSAVPAPVPYANLTNPQTLNLYSMVADDPDSFADADGHGDATGGFCDEHRCYSRPANDRNGVTARQAITQTLGIGALTAAVLAAPEALGSALLRNLIGLGIATVPVTGPIIVDTLTGLTPGAPGTLTISSSTRLTSAEISTGVRLAKQTGEALLQSEHVGAEFATAAGKTYDAMGGGKAFEHFGDGSKFMNSIVDHLNKSVDKIAIDLQGASKAQVGVIKDFVKTLTKAQQKKIIYVK